MKEIKAKRRLKDLDFSGDNSHIALVHKDQGGPANGADYKLVLKAGNFTPEFVQKVQEVRVTMQLPDFLRKFFNVYYEDAEVLAAMMGYIKPELPDQEDYYAEYVKTKLESFEILKSMYEGNLTEVIATLTEEQYLQVLNDQLLVEKALEKNSAGKTAEEGSTEAVAKAKESDDVNQAKVEPSGVTTIEKQNMDENEVVELQKSLDSTKVELQKAMEKLAQFEAEKKEAVVKSKTAQITAVVTDEKHSVAIVKAALALDSEEDFGAFVTALTAVTKSVEDTSLFKEQGASTSEEVTKSVGKSGVAKQLEKLTAGK